MRLRNQVHRWWHALALLSTLPAGCRFTDAGSDVLYACEPEGRCASADQVCSRQNLCVPRDRVLRLIQPEGGRRVGGSVPVEASLSMAGRDPETLVLVATKQGGGSATLLLERRQAGRYEGRWIPEAGDGTYELHVLDPETELGSPPVTVEVDTRAPTFLLEVPLPGPRPSTSALILEDPSAPFAWRRDERITLRVTSQDVDVDETRVSLVVTGVGAEGRGRVEAPMALQPDPACMAAYCGSVELDMAEPELAAFRGQFQLTVVGADQAGNLGSGSGGVDVTRWKWMLDTEREIVTSLAIGQRGRLYFGTRKVPEGRVLGVRPDGVVETSLETEPPYDALAIGPSSVGGSEVLFLTVGEAENQPPKLIAVTAREGQLLGECSAGEAYDRGSSRLVLGARLSDGSPKEVALIGFYKASATPRNLKLVALRLGDGAGPCLSQEPLSGEAFPSMVTDGSRFYYSTESSKSVTVEDSGFRQEPLGPCVPGFARLALAGPELVGTNFISGRSTRFDTRGGQCRGFTIEGNEGFSRLTSGMAIDSQLRLFYSKQGRDGSTFYLVRSPLETPGGSPVIERQLAERLSIAPMLGQGGWVYTASEFGRVQVWTRELDLAWEAPELLNGFHGITALDCARDADGSPQARPGVWYVAHASRLSAIIVDGHGLDTDAKWPKGQYDPRNSSNSSVDLKQFACP